MTYYFHDQAEKELEEIEKYFDDIRDELGDRFRDEIQLAISRILKRPQAWQPMTTSTRRCRLNSFPYGLVYMVEAEEVRVIAVMHLHREPNYWVDRL
jgi:plasmid stabilization system protein ParE